MDENTVIMYRMKLLLEQAIETNTNKNKETLNKIQSLINEYLHENCCHQFIDDYIDITPDKGMNIRYCKHCYCEPI